MMTVKTSKTLTTSDQSRPGDTFTAEFTLSSIDVDIPVPYRIEFEIMNEGWEWAGAARNTLFGDGYEDPENQVTLDD